MQFPIHVVVLHARARLKSFMAGQLTQRPYWYVPPLIMFDVGISCSHSFKLLRSAAFSKTGGCNLLSGAFLCQARNYKLKLLNRDTFQDLFFEQCFCPYNENECGPKLFWTCMTFFCGAYNIFYVPQKKFIQVLSILYYNI